MATNYTVTVSELEGGGNDVTIINTKSIRAARKAYAETVARANESCRVLDSYTCRNITDFRGVYRIKLEMLKTNRDGDVENFDTIEQSKEVYDIDEPNLIF